MDDRPGLRGTARTDLRAAAPLPDLPRLLMQGSLALACGVLLLAALLGLAWVDKDIADETDAAMSLARRLSSLAEAAATPDDAAARAQLRALAGEPPGALRHVTLSLLDPEGRVLLPPPPRAAGNGLVEAVVALHRAAFDAPDTRHVEWRLPRPDGRHWTVRLTASHEDERREAIASLLWLFGLLITCTLALLAGMRWNLRRAFAPLGSLLAAIGNISRGERDGRPSGPPSAPDTAAARALPTMPVQELETLAEALRHLGTALDATEADRRLLASRLQTLQDDERARLARELHDEFGQRLTALRADAAWLQRCTADQPQLQTVVASIAAHGQAIAQDIRGLLARLQPFAGTAEAGVSATVPLSLLIALLRALVDSWIPRLAAAGTRLDLELAWREGPRRRQPWPADEAQAWPLPRALALALYRISQEALTNVARHADARQVRLTLDIRHPTDPAEPAVIAWSVVDDGVGLDDAPDAMQRGNGLVGLRDRVWALGADLEVGPASADGRAAADADRAPTGRPDRPVADRRPGLRLAATFGLPWDGDEPAGARADEPARAAGAAQATARTST